MAWQRTSLEAIVKSFKKCCMSSAVDRTGGDMLWNGSKEDGNVKCKCVRDEGTDCEDGDSDTDWYRQIESDTLCIY